jgi:hypothetical protein
MNTAANLLVILIFLAAFYTVLGLLCGIVEKVRELTARPYQRRRATRPTRRRTPRRSLASAGGNLQRSRRIPAAIRAKSA